MVFQLEKEYQMPKLRDVLPHEAVGGEYFGDRFQKFLDVEVTQVYGLGDGERRKSWPGPHKNVMNWYALANGKAVGWNENDSRGWSFPVITVR
jgi:hypothetical protein